MAYHGYIPLIHEYAQGFENPKILEIGVSTGITAFSLIQRLCMSDHNYYTVEKELSHLGKISHNKTLVICDDYHGRWAEKDLFYAERPEYADNKIATKRIDSDKAGVKNAIDDFLKNNNQWVKFTPIPGEPVVLLHKDHPVIKNNQLIVDNKDE